MRAAPLLAAVTAAALSAAGCGSGDSVPADAKHAAFKLTDAGCTPRDATLPAGPTVFEVENAGSASVTELEVLDGDEIVGEAENITEGLSSSFTATLEKGSYTLACGDDTRHGRLTVVAKQAGGSS